jgi:hypothetical protein
MTQGWPTAVIRSVLAVVVLGLTAELIVLLAHLGGDEPDGSLLAIRVGGLLFYSFNRVGVVFDSQQAELLGTGNTLVVAAMSGTILAGWLLARAGRSVAEEVQGTAIVRGLHGMKVAVPYSLACFAGSFLISFSLPVADVGRFEVHPSHLAALLWPMGLGVAFGFAGGFLSGRVPLWPADPLGRRLRGVVAGGWRMMLLGLALAFAGLLILAMVKPEVTRTYVDWAFAGGPLTGTALLLLHAAVVPNMAAWILFPSMGACLSISSGPEFSCMISYSAFPTGPGLDFLQAAVGSAPHFPPPAPGWFLFLLVPAAATVVGGWTAARKAAATGRVEAIGVGALAGVAYALLAIPVVILAGIVLQLSGSIGEVFTSSGPLRIGPDIGQGVLVALLWGVGGGAAGGLVGGGSALGRGRS